MIIGLTTFHKDIVIDLRNTDNIFFLKYKLQNKWIFVRHTDTTYYDMAVYCIFFFKKGYMFFVVTKHMYDSCQSVEYFLSKLLGE